VTLRRRIGYVLQEGGLLPHRTVLDNIATVLRLAAVPRQASRARSAPCLQLAGLARHLADRYPSQPSGRRQPTVGVSRALAVDPELLRAHLIIFDWSVAIAIVPNAALHNFPGANDDAGELPEP